MTLHVTELPFPARFWDLAAEDPDTGCWEWLGVKAAGYGRFQCRTDEADGASWLAHRLAWELEYGPVPTDTLDHLCRNRACVNPGHLEPTTRGENVRRGEVGKWDRGTLCRKGHEFTPENTRRTPQGWRACRRCECIKQARYRAERAAGLR